MSREPLPGWLEAVGWACAVGASIAIGTVIGIYVLGPMLWALAGMLV